MRDRRDWTSFSGGWSIFALHHSHEGAPSLRFCKGGRRCCRRNSCPFYTARCVCRRRTALFAYAKGRGTRICGGFCSLKAAPPAPPTFRFPERTRVALRSDLAHDNHQTPTSYFACASFVQLRQVYRVSGSSPPIDRYSLRSPWVHFQCG